MRVLLLAVIFAWTSITNVKTTFDQDTFPANYHLKDGEKFDYIVVGAGAAGAAVAARLTLAGYDVLLIEAGGDPNFISKIPVASMALLGSEIDWQYKTIPNNVSCLSSEDQQCRFHRGRCLGGSTSINYMMYTRGNRKKDFEDIPYPGWTFDDLMPYFLRYEGLRHLPRLPQSSKSYHNTTGTIPISFFESPHNPWHSRLKKAFISLQFPENLDVNAESQIGVSRFMGYVNQGERMSTAKGYLAREDVRKTLKLAKNTMCTGVLINKKKITRGVTVVQNLNSVKVFARKEVILSAGAIGTPQILMLSGIGPADHLISMDIPVKVDLPVGDYMSDHMLPAVIMQVDSDVGIIKDLKLLTSNTSQLANMLMKWNDVFSSNGLTDIGAFVNTRCYDFNKRRLLTESTDGSDCEVPNLQIIHSYIERHVIELMTPLVKRATGFNDHVINQLKAANENYAFIMISPVLLEPHSTGNVRLASKDPLAPPAIYPNYLGDERDVDEMVLSINIVEHIVETNVFKRRNASILHLNLPECPSYEYDKQSYWRCYVRHMTFAVYHATGTAQLGTVVDARLRVLGVQRLRVADLSVLPRPPRANTAAVAIAIGERIVDFLVEDNKL